MARLLLVLLTISAVSTAACTVNQPWPAFPVATASLAWTPSKPVATIDVLPLDLELWTDPSYEVDLDELHSAAEASIMSLASDALAARRYKVASQIDSSGLYAGGTALSQADLHATLDALARYGAVAAAAPGRLPVPFLPARLGTATGADATLYIGGWGYIAAPEQGSNDDLIGVAAFLAAVAAIFIVAEAESSHDHHGSTSSTSHHGSGSSGGSGGNGHTATTGTVRGGTATGGHTATAISHSPSIGTAHPTGIVGPSSGNRGRLVTGMIDAFGRIATNLAIVASDELDWCDDPALPHEGGESRLYLEMTLVENLTGHVLWHAHQEFPASAEQPGDIARATRTMLEALPGRAGPAAPAPH